MSASKTVDGSTPRRKSMGLFPRSSLSGLVSFGDDQPGKNNRLSRMKHRPASVQSSGSPLENARKGSTHVEDDPDSPKFRPRTLVKSSRPTSLFGSLRSLNSAEEEEHLTTTISAVSSTEGERKTSDEIADKILLHGEVQTSGGMFRKRKGYLVLTETHLVRFKGIAHASEAYPSESVGGTIRRNKSLRHMSMTSVTSLHDLQSLASQSSHENYRAGIPLNQVVAVYKVEDGRPIFTLEVAHLDTEINTASSFLIQLTDPRDGDLWLSSIRAAAIHARLVEPIYHNQKTQEYAIQRLMKARDYDPDHFQVFKVLQRMPSRSESRSSTDDLTKLGSSVRYLAVGEQQLHTIPLQGSSHRLSSSSLSDLNRRTSFGLLSLVSIKVRATDDAFELAFRIPLQPPTILYFASSHSSDIVVWVRQLINFLRPEWIEQPLIVQNPQDLEDSIVELPPMHDDHRSFDRTLIAYCAAYAIDTSVICYTIIYDAEDAPCMTLLPPASNPPRKYTVLELLAFLRALRYNESFCSISFRGVSLDCLHQLRDEYGQDHVPYTTRSGLTLNFNNLARRSLLIQELQALAVKNKRLRRLDFTSCITRRPKDGDEDYGIDPGCEICEALFPLCRRQLTNVDWIILSGIELGETDLDYLVDAAVERACHLRALEVSSCGLTERSLQLVFNAMHSQESTLESIDISGNLARLSPSTFQGQIGFFGRIRKLNLSRVQRTTGPEPLVSPETLLAWRLEELCLSHTPLNTQTVDSISAYLATPTSDTLGTLELNQCGLTGRDLAVFMHSMSRAPGVARNLHLHVSENRLEKDHSQFVEAVANGLTPTSLTMKMVEYKKEDHFRELIQAIKRNKTLRFLDISKASLPYDASEETCEALQLMFAENETLEELDISGEHAHLEVAKFGIGLNHALTGLRKNNALKILHVEYQKLGLQGASTLATVLETNKTLQQIYCEHNDINLQGLTVLVNALTRNTSVLYLPPMDRERFEALQTVQREVESMRTENMLPSAGKANAFRRSMAVVVGSAASSKVNQTASGAPIDQDVNAAVAMVNEKWDKQVDRLQKFLHRNHNIANGLPIPEGEEYAVRRPTTAEELAVDLAGILKHVTVAPQ